MTQSGDCLQLRQRIVAASGASVASALVVNPLDVVKTRMQAQVSSEVFRGGPAAAQPLVEGFAIAGCSTSCPRPDQLHVAQLCRGPECSAYGSTLDGFRKIIRREGALALWRGTDMALLMAIPMVGVYLPLYDYLVAHVSSAGMYAPLLAGATARTAAVMATSPLELLRVRMQALEQPSQQRQAGKGQPTGRSAWPLDRASAAGAWRDLPRIGGNGTFGYVRTLWTGVGATLARDVPFSAIYWGMLEPIRHSLLPSDGQRVSPSHLLAVNFAAGSIGGASAAAITTPLDVVKTRAQLSNRSERQGLLASLRGLAAEGGGRALFAGVVPRATRAAPACAIVLACYELLKASPFASA